MINLFVNGIAVQVDEGAMILDACIAAGQAVPHICYDKGLKTAGSCQMCMVDTDISEKPVMSCCTAAVEGMHIFTETQQIKELRKGLIELLLARHPAGCPTCQKSGDCLLQEVCFEYGKDSSDLKKKISVEEQNLGPLVRTDLKKCILCMKCLHFLDNLAGIHEMSLMGRSDSTQLKAFSKGVLGTMLSGNLIDLCPAGALTDKTAEFLWRPWEMTRLPSIDVMDGVCSPIYIDVVQGKIARIVPRAELLTNDRWISDKARFSFDGLGQNRIDRPYVRIDGVLQEASWTEALMTIASKMKDADPKRIAGLIGDFADCESMMALYEFMDSLGVKSVEVRTGGLTFDISCRQSWLFNTTLSRLDEADALLMIGTDIRLEAPLVNLRIKGNPMPTALLGEKADQGYPYQYLGNDPTVLEKILKGTHPFASVLKKAQRPMIIVGEDVLAREDAQAILETIYQINKTYAVITEGWNGYNLLQRKVSVIGGLEMGLVRQEPLLPQITGGEYDVVYLLNEDNLSREDLGKAFVIYQGIYASKAARSADVILPGLAYTEKHATYVNIEGRAQSTEPVLPPVGSAREDWKILRALSAYFEKPLPYDDLNEVRDHLGGYSIIFYKRGDPSAAEDKPFGTAGKISAIPFSLSEKRFFESDMITASSKNMQALKKAWVEKYS